MGETMQDRFIEVTRLAVEAAHEPDANGRAFVAARKAFVAEIDALAARLAEAERERDEARNTIARLRVQQLEDRKNAMENEVTNVGTVRKLQRRIAELNNEVDGRKEMSADVQLALAATAARKDAALAVLRRLIEEYDDGGSDWQSGEEWWSTIMLPRAVVNSARALLSAAPATTDAGEGRET